MFVFSQDDPAGASVKIISNILSEMAALFPDEVMKRLFALKALLKMLNTFRFTKTGSGPTSKTLKAKAFLSTGDEHRLR